MHFSRYHFVEDVPILVEDYELFGNSLRDMVDSTNLVIQATGDHPPLFLGWGEKAIGFCENLSIKTDESGNQVAYCDMRFVKQLDAERVRNFYRLSCEVVWKSSTDRRLGQLLSVALLYPDDLLNRLGSGEINPSSLAESMSEPEPDAIVVAAAK